MYVSLDELKRYLGISSNADDTLLTELLSRAQAIVDSATSRSFESTADETRVFKAERDTISYTLFLRDDICQITSVVNGDGTTLSTSDYYTEPAIPPFWAIVLLAGHQWHGDIQVTGRWAYSVTAPLAIVHATVRLAAWLYRQKDSSADIDRPLLTGDGVTIMPSALPSDVLSILAHYKRYV